jgi:hypothetical protein
MPNGFTRSGPSNTFARMNAPAYTAANDAAKADKQRKEKAPPGGRKADRQRQAERRMAVKPISYFIKQAQHAFNEFIRYRTGFAVHQLRSPP